MRRAVAHLAQHFRKLFDRASSHIGVATIVGAFTVLTMGTGGLQLSLLQDQCTVPIKILQLEVTFSTSRFARMLGPAGACRDNAVCSLVTWDMLFPFGYSCLLCSLYLWAERWRRFDGSHKLLRPGPSPRLLSDTMVLAPLIAGGLDLIFENLPLWYAAQAIALDGSSVETIPVTICVWVGSLAALVKWLLVPFSVIGLLGEVVVGRVRARFT